MINYRTRNERAAMEHGGIKKETSVFGIKKFLHSLYKHQNQKYYDKVNGAKKTSVSHPSLDMMYAGEDINTSSYK